MAAIRETTYARQRLIGLLGKAESVLKHLGPGDHPSGSSQEVHAGMGGGNWNMSLEELRFAGLHLPVDDTVLTRWLGSRSDLRGLEDYPYDASSGDQPETLETLRKKQVMKKLAATLKDNPDFQAYVKIRIEQIVPFSDDPTEAVVANMVHAWAESSGDHNPQSLYIQQAIIDEFGLSDEVNVTGHLTADMQKWYSRDAGAYRAFVRAQYDLTQVELAKHGIKELVLFRGMNWDNEFDWTTRGYDKGGWMDLEQQPISSYSWNYRVANDFAMNDRFRAIIAVKVPASSIFSTPLTGIGSLVEHEVVVMNNSDMRGLVRGTTFGGSSTVLDFLRFAEIQGGLKSKRLKINVDSPQHNADWIPTLVKLRIAGIIPMKGRQGSKPRKHYGPGPHRSGSSQDVHGHGETTRVGITSQSTRHPISNAQVFVDMKKFKKELMGIEGVTNVSVIPGKGAWLGGGEGTWIVSYEGNGKAIELLARTGAKFDQDAVLVYSQHKIPNSVKSLYVDYSFKSVLPVSRGRLEQVLAAHGLQGWTWLRSSGKTTLRLVAVPQWDMPGNKLMGISSQLDSVLSQVYGSAPKQVKSAWVTLMELKGDSSYDSFIH